MILPLLLALTTPRAAPAPPVLTRVPGFMVIMDPRPLANLLSAPHHVPIAALCKALAAAFPPLKSGAAPLYAISPAGWTLRLTTSLDGRPLPPTTAACRIVWERPPLQPALGVPVL